MSETGMARQLRVVVGASALASVIGLSGVALLDGIGATVAGGLFLGWVIPIGFGAVVWIAAPSQPANRLLWVLTAFAASTGLYMIGQLAIGLLAPELARPLDVDTTVPAQVPPTALAIEAVTVSLASAGQYAMLTFGVLLFPDGRLPSRRWRPVAWFVGIGLVAMASGVAASWHPANTATVVESPFFHATSIFFFLGPVAALAAIVVRFLRSDRSTRSRVKWIIWGAATFVPLTVLGSASGVWPLSVLGTAALIAAYGAAITRQRLFDVDVVISRTFVFGALALFITGVYVAVVVGLGSALGGGDEPNTGLALFATAAIAIAFQPVRRRLERVANRLVFGRRATPYEVLSDFSRKVAATGDTLLADAAQSLVAGTGAERVTISVGVDDNLVEAAAWPVAPSGSRTTMVRFAIVHDGATLGSLDLHHPPGQELGGDDRRLATQVASGMGLALRNRQLTERLEARVTELRASRRRLVAVQDDTRRRLERDLHDGAQQQLVALKVKLGLARALAQRAGAADTAALLDRLGGDADAVVHALRDFARGVYPPLLEAEGLGAALTAQARRAPLPVTVSPDGIGRYDRDVETTVYFCVLEALRTVGRRAGASQAWVTLAEQRGSLTFEVRDDGAGSAAGNGDGHADLATMIDRVDALAGDLRVSEGNRGGTAITGVIPVRAATDASR